jgi:RES domain-containing protein
MLEYFVHIDLDDPPEDLVLATADIPDTVARVEIAISQLAASWRQTPAPPELAAIGDEFFESRRATILIVPSALAPSESNWLINPLHPGFSKIKLRPVKAFRYDLRFFR